MTILPPTFGPRNAPGYAEPTPIVAPWMRRPDRKPLTDRQRAILAFLVEHLCEHQRMPSLREICARFGIASTNGVSDTLRALARKGYVELPMMKSRAVRVVGLRLAPSWE